MKKIFLLGLAATALVLVVTKSISPALAYQGDSSVKGPNYSETRHKINITAFKTGDYETWVKNMTGRGATRFVTKENFAEFAKARLAELNGDKSLIEAFRIKYNWGQGKGMRIHR